MARGRELVRRNNSKSEAALARPGDTHFPKGIENENDYQSDRVLAGYCGAGRESSGTGGNAQAPARDRSPGAYGVESVWSPFGSGRSALQFHGICGPGLRPEPA